MVSYRAASAADLRIVPLDALTLLYHRPAGATHLLAEPAPQIIAELQTVALDPAALLERLAAKFDLADASPATITARLDELIEAGLVTTA